MNKWIDVLILLIIVLAIIGGVVFLAVDMNNNSLTSEYTKFQECLAMEYPRDFCLALVD